MVGGLMYGSEKILRAVESKIDEVLGRPDVQKEMQDAIDSSVLGMITEETKRRAKEHIQDCRGAFHRQVQSGCDKYLEDHKEEIMERIEKATLEAMKDETILQAVAKDQFGRFLGKMAGEAVERAMIRKTKKDTKSAK
jgi:hypothetical protein